MGSAGTCDAKYSLERVLYMAIELDDNRWMLGFTTGLGQRPRKRSIATRDTAPLEREIQPAKRRFHLPEDDRVLSCYEAGREGFSRKDIGTLWLHRYLIDIGVNNEQRGGRRRQSGSQKEAAAGENRPSRPREAAPDAHSLSQRRARSLERRAGSRSGG